MGENAESTEKVDLEKLCDILPQGWEAVWKKSIQRSKDKIQLCPWCYAWPQFSKIQIQKGKIL